MSQPAPTQIFSTVAIRYRNGEATKLEHVVHQVQATPSQVIVIFEQPRGDRTLIFVNMAEVTDIVMVPSKVDLA